jgi:methyl-accepting chemotaxis protein
MLYRSLCSGGAGLDAQDSEMQSEPIPGIESRYALFGLDANTRNEVKALWPIVAPHAEHALDLMLAAVAHLPNISQVVEANRDGVKDLEIAHLEALTSGDLGAEYFASCRRTVEQESVIGLDARFRGTAGNYLLRVAVDVLARKYRFAPGKIAKYTKLISQVIAFDVANAMALHREASERRRRNRREKIDAAIADFGAAIDEALDAIEGASQSLHATCKSMSELANDTLNRMTIAATAANDTAQRVKVTGEATEQLSASINHIGQEATRGLDMTKAAAGDAQRTQQAILALNETADNIGAIVNIISSIASQTNLLALNATIEAARAGDAGRGFAVVASEVKALASQTSSATEKISQQVIEIQGSTSKSVQEVSSIADVIGHLTATARAIALAVEEQTKTTRNIASSIQTASQSTASASNEIVSVERAAERNARAFDDIANLTAHMTSRAQELKSRVVTFFNRVRAA